MKNVRVFDFGEKIYDRYTVIDMEQTPSNGEYKVLGMNSDPTGPNGFEMVGTTRIGDSLGKEINFDDLPEPCKKVVLMRFARN